MKRSILKCQILNNLICIYNFFSVQLRESGEFENRQSSLSPRTFWLRINIGPHGGVDVFLSLESQYSQKFKFVCFHN